MRSWMTTEDDNHPESSDYTPAKLIGEASSWKFAALVISLVVAMVLFMNFIYKADPPAHNAPPHATSAYHLDQ